ncbi:hypothetical protein B0H65DRAFT_438685 [Neurospora tetraspora]|uniref:2EXR domain-containing protein n=1 Tax=Neurospora tetraspora TaxID=94610 RepID=A0AAE0JPK1_9PEZI|nr:hypothetical protein B0H65DRAFT_438685 [Neurospora tetraspora]
MSHLPNPWCTQKDVEENVPLEDISTDQTRPKPNNTPNPKYARTFHPFPKLPTELRLQIWRLAAESACRNRNVHRVRLKLVADISTSPNHNNYDSKTSSTSSTRPILLPTPSLILSTHASRNLLTICSESRSEILNGPSASYFLPDKLILRTRIPTPTTGGGGQARERGRGREREHERAVCGILHCNLSRDVILLENISSSDVLVESETAIRTLGQHLLGPLRGVENLGLDFLGSQGSVGLSSGYEYSRGEMCDLEDMIGKSSKNQDDDSENINWYMYGGQYAGESKLDDDDWWRRVVPYYELLCSLEQVAIGLEDMLHLPPTPSFFYEETESGSGGAEDSPAEEISSSGWLRKVVHVGILGQFGGRSSGSRMLPGVDDLEWGGGGGGIMNPDGFHI